MDAFKSILIFISALISSCISLPSKDIELVKNLSLPGFVESDYFVRDFVADIAGKNGAVQWSAFLPEGYKNNQKVAGVQADINRNTGTHDLIQIQFLYNKATESARISRITVDGIRKSKLEFYLILIDIGINSVKSDLDL